MNIRDIELAIQELKREKWEYAKREETRREVDAVMRRMDGLESALREACSQIDCLLNRVRELEAERS